MARPPLLLIRSPATWLVLVSPARTEIVEALRLLGPCSAAQVAEVLDRPADTLYRHIDALKRAGFVRDAGLRKLGRNAEQLFDVAADDFAIDFAGGAAAAAENRALLRTANTFLKAMSRTVRDTAAVRGLDARSDSRNLSISYELSWLTPESFREVRALIRRLKELMDEGKKKREGRLYMSLAMACPVTRKRGARRVSSERAGRASKTAGAPVHAHNSVRKARTAAGSAPA